MNKNGSKGQLLNMEEESSPQPTPEASFDGNATNNRIHQSNPKINPSEQKTSKKVSTDDSVQFSLPSKPQSAGARAKANANRSRSKVYTRDDAVKIAQAVMQDSHIFATENGKFVGKLRGKGKLIDELWARLNRTEAGTAARERAAAELADWMGWFNDVNGLNGQALDGRAYDLQNIRTNLEYLANGKGALTVPELQMLSITLQESLEALVD